MSEIPWNWLMMGFGAGLCLGSVLGLSGMALGSLLGWGRPAEVEVGEDSPDDAPQPVRHASSPPPVPKKISATLGDVDGVLSTYRGRDGRAGKVRRSYVPPTGRY